jgi:hypothetical protein
MVSGANLGIGHCFSAILKIQLVLISNLQYIPGSFFENDTFKLKTKSYFICVCIEIMEKCAEGLQSTWNESG